MAQVVKNLPAMQETQAGDMGSAPWLGRFPWRRKCNPFQYACLENPMDRGAWRATVPESQRVRHDWSHWAHTHWGQPFFCKRLECKKFAFTDQMPCVTVPQLSTATWEPSETAREWMQSVGLYPSKMFHKGRGGTSLAPSPGETTWNLIFDILTSRNSSSCGPT